MYNIPFNLYYNIILLSWNIQTISSQVPVELINCLCVLHTYLARRRYFPAGGRNYHSLSVLGHAGAQLVEAQR